MSSFADDFMPPLECEFDFNLPHGVDVEQDTTQSITAVPTQQAPTAVGPSSCHHDPSQSLFGSGNPAASDTHNTDVVESGIGFRMTSLTIDQQQDGDHVGSMDLFERSPTDELTDRGNDSRLSSVDSVVIPPEVSIQYQSDVTLLTSTECVRAP